MNSLKNRVQLIGNLGQAPEVKQLESGKQVARLSLATNEVYRKENGEKVTETHWHSLTAWGKLAEIAQKYLTKGSEIAIEGRLTYREYTDKDGIKRYATEIVVTDLLMLDKKSGNEV